MSSSRDTTIAVIGLGYVGLPSAALFAGGGFHVTGVDIDPDTVEAVNSGRAPFVEPGLTQLVAEGVASGRLRAQRETPHADVYLIAVPTPVLPGGQPDVRHVEAATDGIIEQLRGGELVVIESTCPPGTARAMAERMARQRPDLRWDDTKHETGDDTEHETEPDERPVVEFAHCPERVLPGKAMVELVENSRIIGGLTPSAAHRAATLYATVCRGEIRTTSAETAELAKLTENAFRDVNIAFANELSLVSSHLDVDVWELIELANLHPRVNILQPGPGVGGHCIAVDPWFIVAAAPQESRLIRTAREVNDHKPHVVRRAIIEAVERTRATHVACLGIAFKADIDDLRGSPALAIVRDLAQERPDLVFDIAEPNVEALPGELHRENVRHRDVEEAIAGADVVALLVDHTRFRAIDHSELEGKEVIDTRGVWR